jgi:hypothetical protein
VLCSAVSNLVGVSERAQESVFLGAGEGPRGSAACSSAERVREREGVDLGAGERAATTVFSLVEMERAAGGAGISSAESVPREWAGSSSAKREHARVCDRSAVEYFTCPKASAVGCVGCTATEICNWRYENSNHALYSLVVPC